MKYQLNLTALRCPIPLLSAKKALKNLDKCGEILGARLNTIHNLRYYQRLMAEIRQAIEDDHFDDFVVEFYARMGKPVPPLQLADNS